MIDIFKRIIKEIDPIFELFVYLLIALAISKLFLVTFIQGLYIVAVFFLFSLLRIFIQAKLSK